MFRWWHGRKKNSLPVPSETSEVWRCRWCFPFAFNISDSKVSLKGLAAGMCLLPCFMNLNGFGHQATSCSWQVAGRSTAYLQSDASDSECKPWPVEKSCCHGIQFHRSVTAPRCPSWMLHWRSWQLAIASWRPKLETGGIWGDQQKVLEIEFVTCCVDASRCLGAVFFFRSSFRVAFCTTCLSIANSNPLRTCIKEFGKFERVPWWIQGKAKATWDGTILIVLLSLWNRVAQGGYEQAFSFARSNDQFVLSVEWCWASVL